MALGGVLVEEICEVGRELWFFDPIRNHGVGERRTLAVAAEPEEAPLASDALDQHALAEHIEREALRCAPHHAMP
jgi:hypothetical protein